MSAILRALSCFPGGEPQIGFAFVGAQRGRETGKPLAVARVPRVAQPRASQALEWTTAPGFSTRILLNVGLARSPGVKGDCLAYFSVDQAIGGHIRVNDNKFFTRSAQIAKLIIKKIDIYFIKIN